MKIYLLFFILLITFPLCAQTKNQIKVEPYIMSDPGRYAALEYGRIFKKDHLIAIGVLFHYNNSIENPDRHQEYYLHHRFKAYDNLEHFGLSLGYQYTFLRFNQEKISLFAYDHMMFRNMGARSRRWIPVDTIFNYDNYGVLMDLEISKLEYTHIRNLLSLENITGIGLSAKISKHLSVEMKTGLGFNYIYNLPKDLFDKKSLVQYSFQFGFAMSYGF